MLSIHSAWSPELLQSRSKKSCSHEGVDAGHVHSLRTQSAELELSWCLCGGRRPQVSAHLGDPQRRQESDVTLLPAAPGFSTSSPVLLMTV
eukprot:1729165-Prymnesium_polylepis.1